MSKSMTQIDALDVTIFDGIASQTHPGERRSLLAIQRTTRRAHRHFSYLEIGSHLGGSIQPYLIDDQCRNIYSIDPRPAQQPDDRTPNHIARYRDNSTARMLELLRSLNRGDLNKIICFDCDAAEVDPGRIESAPQVAFIDGEHTRTAAWSDFQVCLNVISPTGTIVFHDAEIIYPALIQACNHLRKLKRSFVALRLEDSVFAIFLDPEKVQNDAYLKARLQANRARMILMTIKFQTRRWLPAAMLRSLRSGIQSCSRWTRAYKLTKAHRASATT